VAEGRTTGAAGAGPAWWSDALNDPWRNPETPAVILTGAESTQPPEADTGTFRGGGRGIASIVVVAATVGLLAGALGGALGYYAATQQREPAVQLGAPEEAPPPLRTSDSMPELISRVMPSVVTVQGTSGQETSLGSGFVITRDGYILTNEHVVAEIAEESDLAVLKIERDNLRPVEFGDSDGVAVGDGVLAIGSPLALPGTVTSGIVSALDRPIESHEASGVQRYYAAIQTDAAVNRGSSGGPLFDLNGRVIGINSVIKSLVEDGQETGNIGIAFAIPINHAGRVASEIIDTGKARRTVIGAQVDDFRSGGGARLTTVDAGGPAEAAGLRSGDVVVRLGTHIVDQPHDLIALVRRYDPGTTVTITYRRGAETQTASVTLVADAN
jgi:putative serine protease PepD